MHVNTNAKMYVSKDPKGGGFGGGGYANLRSMILETADSIYIVVRLFLLILWVYLIPLGVEV